MELCDEGVVKLLSAILEEARDDYIRLKSRNLNTIEIRNFLHSEMGQLCILLIPWMDEDTIIDRWNEQAMRSKHRYRHICERRTYD